MSSFPITASVFQKVDGLYLETTPSFSSKALYALAKLVALVVAPIFLIVDLLYGLVTKSPHTVPPAAGVTIMQKATGPIEFYDFYAKGERNREGVTFEEILIWDDHKLEAMHNYIQWLFPLLTQSGSNPNLPLFDTQTADQFRRDPRVQQKVLNAFKRMLRFYGLVRDEQTGVITRAGNCAERERIWLTPHNHNFLRVTRMIESLDLMGLSNDAKAFQTIMNDIAFNEGSGIVSADTLGRWNS